MVEDTINTLCREGWILQATQVESGEPVYSPTITVNSPLPPVLPKCMLKECFTTFYMLGFSCISLSACFFSVGDYMLMVNPWSSLQGSFLASRAKGCCCNFTRLSSTRTWLGGLYMHPCRVWGFEGRVKCIL